MVGCGPVVTPGSTGSTTSAETGEDTRSVEPPATTRMTNAVTTSPPGDATDGPLDTGVVDTGELLLDFPAYCSLFAQDCPPGYKCVPYNTAGGGWIGRECVPIVDDPQGVGEPCVIEGPLQGGPDNCEGGSMCWVVEVESLEGTCVPLCIGSMDEPACADACRYCWTSVGFSGLCVSTCDPVAQNCAEGEGCYPIGDYFECGPDASPPGTTVGSPCEFINVCPPGLICEVSSEVPGCEGALGCCTPVCSLGGFDPCPKLLPGTVCVPWFDEPPPPENCLVSEPGVCAVP